MAKVSSQADKNKTEGFIDCRQLNLQKSKIACANFGKEIENMSAAPFICFLQEPYVVADRMCLMTGGQHFNGKNPRAGIIASKSLDVWAVTTLTARDWVTCILRLDQNQRYREVILATIYMDITDNLEKVPHSRSASRSSHRLWRHR